MPSHSLPWDVAVHEQRRLVVGEQFQVLPRAYRVLLEKLPPLLLLPASAGVSGAVTVTA